MARFQFGSIIQQVSAWAEQFRAENLSETATYTHDGHTYTLHISPYSITSGRWDIEGFGMFDDQAIFVCFVREFRVADRNDRTWDFPSWLWKKGGERHMWAWPMRGDTLTIRSAFQSSVYEVVSTKNNPAWVYYDADPGRRTILVNTRRCRT